MNKRRRYLAKRRRKCASAISIRRQLDRGSGQSGLRYPSSARDGYTALLITDLGAETHKLTHPLFALMFADRNTPRTMPDLQNVPLEVVVVCPRTAVLRDGTFVYCWPGWTTDSACSNYYENQRKMVSQAEMDYLKRNAEETLRLHFEAQCPPDYLRLECCHFPTRGYQHDPYVVEWTALMTVAYRVKENSPCPS